MTLPVTLQFGSHSLVVNALIDSGSDASLMSFSLAKTFSMNLIPLSEHIALFLADGKPAAQGYIKFSTPLVKLHIDNHIEMINLYSCELSHPVILGLDWLRRHNPVVDWSQLKFTFTSDYCKSNCLSESKQLNAAHIETGEKLSSQVYPYLACNDTVSSEDFPESLVSEFQDLFNKNSCMELPKRSQYDFPVDLIPGFKPPHGKVYSLTPPESQAMTNYIKENLEKGFIRPSRSPAAAPCFFVGKKDGSLRPIQDYRGLNSGTIKNRYPIPLISDLLRDLARGKIFTTLDLRGAYNLVRIKAGDEWKTAFICKEGQFEQLVMSFGFANAPAHFQGMMNSIFKDLIGVYVLIYLDDIIIFSEDESKHPDHVRTVLQRLRENNLFCKLEKCFYGKPRLEFLGYVISGNGIEMDPRKTQSIQEWPTPSKTHDIQVFLGFTNFYRRFITNYAKVTQPLTGLLKKDTPFNWSAEAQESFSTLKSAFKAGVVLAHPNESKEFLVEVDASDYALGGVLSQYSDQNELVPVAFFSRQMVPAERNYEIYDKELLAITVALKEWRHFLQGSIHPFTILTDHKNLEYFMTSKQLTRRQARWSLFLSEFNFNLSYRPGSHNGKADHLSRRPDYKVDEERSNFIQLLKPSMIVAPVSVKTGTFSHALKRHIFFEKDWPLLVCHFLLTDEWLTDIPEKLLKTVKEEAGQFTASDLGKFCRVIENGKRKVPYCPSWERVDVYRRFHQGLGHLKFDSVFDLVARRFWWPSMKQDLKEAIRSCPECQLDQSSGGTHCQTPIRPVPSVAIPFERWGVDFIQDLPVTKAGNRHIITAIDYASRWVVAKAVKNRDSTTVAQFYYELMMNYGTPLEIISDRGSAFLSEGLREFEKLQNIRHHATTPYHPQTNGMVERMHSMMGHAITTLCQGRSDRWDEYLQQTLFALRVRKHAVTKLSPFFLIYGLEPRLPGDDSPHKAWMEPLDELEEIEEQAEYQARTFEELGQARAAAYTRSTAQAEVMRRRNNWDPASDDYYFKIGDMVKLKHHSKTKFEFDWKGPYHVVDVGHPGTYWLMEPSGRRLDCTMNERDLAPWLHPTSPGICFFDGTSRSDLGPEEGGSVIAP